MVHSAKERETNTHAENVRVFGFILRLSKPTLLFFHRRHHTESDFSHKAPELEEK